MYKEGDKIRIPSGYTYDSGLHQEPYRSPFRKDFSRLIHSPSFRRLQGKTQLFPGIESDFFRNRLTHSLEVAQIAKSIALGLNHSFKERKFPFQIDPTIVEFAGLAHDLGHPPFGHQGEMALDEEMKDYGGFEGNAQTLRIITKLAKRFSLNGESYGIEEKSGKLIDNRYGMHLTSRTIASILKYDNPIPIKSKNRPKNVNDKPKSPVKGYYYSEKKIVEQVRLNILGKWGLENDEVELKTIECQIMDIADDIAYSTYDIEDAFKGGFLSSLDMVFPKVELLDKVADKIKENDHPQLKGKNDEEIKDIIKENIMNVFSTMFELPDPIRELLRKSKNLKDRISMLGQYIYELDKVYTQNGYFRTEFTSKLVGSHVRNVSCEPEKNYPHALYKVKLHEDNLLVVEILKHFVFQSIIQSPALKIVEFRGKDIVKKIFRAIDSANGALLPDDFKFIYDLFGKQGDVRNQKRLICDFIAGMTDKYAIQFYGRLASEEPTTIFKPL